MEAAKAAEAAFAGKEAVVDQLQEEVKEAEAVVQEESSSLQQTQSNVNSAVRAAQEVQQEVRIVSFKESKKKRNIFLSYF